MARAYLEPKEVGPFISSVLIFSNLMSFSGGI
jgi:hypothetical protein